ncbi:MAG TPA: polysaccharide deacetylase family protein, partial [Caulobacteraceae bacterium]
MAASLAERLGYGADERLLIVNCDDLGSSHAANQAIEESIRQGFATSATLMVPCPWAFEAAKAFEDLDIGVHLTLTAEYPGYRWRALTGAASLHDADGFMPATAEAVFACADPAEVRAECRAQIDQALAWGVDVTHLDSHMGTVQTDARFYDVYAELAAEYRLPLRMARAGAEKFLGFAFRQPATERGLVFPDYLLAPRWGFPTRQVLIDSLQRLRPGVTEVFLHPAVDGPELRGYDKAAPEIRFGDYANLLD